jgi:phage regulator Rha-like protein
MSKRRENYSDIAEDLKKLIEKEDEYPRTLSDIARKYDYHPVYFTNKVVPKIKKEFNIND